MSSRRHVHKRSITADVYARDDGLWDVEAELVDTKSRDFMLASGSRPAGTPIHRMQLTLTVDAHLNVVRSEARSLDHPYPGHCEAIEPAYRQLVGLNLLRGFRRAVRERLGGIAGCTHLTELSDVLPTAVVQAFAGEVERARGGIRDHADAQGGAAPSEVPKPFQLDRCHALRSDGPAVARFYPRWYRSEVADDAEDDAADNAADNAADRASGAAREGSIDYRTDPNDPRIDPRRGGHAVPSLPPIAEPHP